MKKVIVYAFIAINILACKKEPNNIAINPNTNPSPSPTRTALLTTGTWNITGIIFNGSDIFSSFPQCEKDNTYTFKTNNIAIIDEGLTRCDPGDPQSKNTAWAFIDNDTRLILDGDTAPIQELTATTLKVFFQDASNATIMTFSH